MKDPIKQGIDDVLSKVRDGVLALTDGKIPYCIPFGFVYVNEAIYLSMFPTGRKWGYIQQNPMACFNVFRWNEDFTEYFSVLVEGKLEPVTDIETVKLVVEANIKKIGLDPDQYLEKHMAYFTKNLDNPKGLRLFKLNAKEAKGKKKHTTTVGT